MKSIRSLITSGIAALSLAAPALAVSTPTPVKVVHPTDLSRTYQDAEVTVRFTLDRTGAVHNVAPEGAMDKALAARVLPAVAQWKFTPCVDARGVPVQRVVILPLKIVDGGA